MTNTCGTCRHREKMVIINNAEKFKQIFGIYATELWAMPEEEFLKWLSAVEIMPSVEAEPVRHGHWMPYENQNQDDVNNCNYLYVCSNCNYSDIHAKTAEVPYCWHCGAKMDEVTQ